MGKIEVYPLVICDIAIENGYLQWIYPLKMVIFHNYVELPGGIECFGKEKYGETSQQLGMYRPEGSGRSCAACPYP